MATANFHPPVETGNTTSITIARPGAASTSPRTKAESARGATPAVSVVMPVCNAAGTLTAAVTDILQQSLRALELIVVDDGSTDRTPALLRELAAGDARLRLIRLPANRGIVPALQRGLAAARGEFIARMDADDRAHPDRLRQQLEHLLGHAEIGLTGSRVRFAGDAAQGRGYALYVAWINSLLDAETIALNRFVESPFAHPSVMFRRRVYERFGGYRAGDFPEDYELWLRWLDAGVRMDKVDAELLDWSDPPTRLSRTDPRYSVRAFYRCKAKWLARWLERHNPRHPEVVIWGAGRETRKRAEWLTEWGVRITHYVDIDPRKIGQVIHGRPVLAEAQLPQPGEVFVVSYVGSRGAREDIRSRLAARGFREGLHDIMAA